MAPIEAVFFDIGETLVDETREYGTWADWLGIPRHTFSTVFGAVIAQGRDYRDAFQVFRPGFDLVNERRRRSEQGRAEWFGENDLYADARPCLTALGQRGVTVGVAGNQTSRAEEILRGLDLPIDVLGTSDGWGATKPSPDFFHRLIAEARAPAERVLYVGDRLDWDVAPAQQVGLATAIVRRGPWGRILRDERVERVCLFDLDGLSRLPDLVREHNSHS